MAGLADDGAVTFGQTLSRTFSYTMSHATSRVSLLREMFGSKLELMLSLVGYAVGLGNIWRFPYLTYTYGGGAFLIPYSLALLTLGLPIFVLELGLGQMFRQGTVGVWKKLGLKRLRGAGYGATLCSFAVCLYYNVIISWTLYYLARTMGSMVHGVLPWSDSVEGFQCPAVYLYPHESVADMPGIVDSATGVYNHSHAGDFWCPSGGSGYVESPPAGYVSMMVQPSSCPAQAAVSFWEKQALEQSSGLDELGGFHLEMLVAFTAAWVLTYLCVFQGIASSGKVVYVTALLPYVVLIVFFVRAITLPNALAGVLFFVKPDFSLLLNGEVWLRAATQIFYSLGIGFGSLIAFASYGEKENDFVQDASVVSAINCGTSVFAGFVVFPILGYLALELSEIDPCIHADNLSELASIGLSGTGLAFIAFPIAIAQMPGGFFWAIMFFVMLLCLGMDSQFAMVESVVTVLRDAGLDRKVSKPVLSGAVCGVMYLMGLVFVTRGGIYWFSLFDYYTSVVTVFVVTGVECVGLMWANRDTFPLFISLTETWTGRKIGPMMTVMWKYVCPALLSVLTAVAFSTWDLMGSRTSKPYPEGSGYLPGWSIWAGWGLALAPVTLIVAVAMLPDKEATASQSEAEPTQPSSAKEDHITTKPQSLQATSPCDESTEPPSTNPGGTSETMASVENVEFTVVGVSSHS